VRSPRRRRTHGSTRRNSMRKLAKRAGVLALVAMALSIESVAGAIACSDYITSAADDVPMTGTLIGESTHTSSTTSGRTISFSWSWLNFGGAYNGSSTETDSYNVGSYRMSNGTIQTIRCDNYTRV
jgi:hypothetical protein